ncbi:carbohydrate ABC transporter permease, partial [Mesorhizobium sp. M7A.F.Ca.US.003.02.2.1]
MSATARTGQPAELLKNGAIQLMLAINAVIMIYPLFVMVMSSFKTNAE